MVNDEDDEIIEERFKSLQNRYPNNLEESMKGSDFVFNYVRLLYYKCRKINPNCGGSYIDSLDRIKKQQKILSIKKIINAFNTLYSCKEEQKLILL